MSHWSEKEMPRYKCHKEVWALKIKRVEEQHPAGEGRASVADAIVYPEDDSYGPIAVGSDWMSRFKGSESDWGYYVLYWGGYKSWSPTKAFEEGYTRAN